ncbi:hypothetical protein MNBD_NITROSPIRAE01-43, partial [hydrothermal vent metagenome]
MKKWIKTITVLSCFLTLTACGSNATNQDIASTDEANNTGTVVQDETIADPIPESISITGPGSVSDGISQDKLLVDYNFDDTDPAILKNGATLGEGYIAQGAVFDGIDDFVDAGPLDLEGETMSVSMWIKAEDFDIQDARLISKSSGTSEQDHYFMLSTIDSNGMKLRFRLKAGGTTSTLIPTSKGLTPNQWIHVVASYDGSMMRLYQDGVKVGEIQKSGLLDSDVNTPVWIARNPDGSRAFHGAIDEVKIYGRSLTETEITQLAQTVLDPTPD